MLYNIYHEFANLQQRYDVAVNKSFVDKMVEAYLKGEAEVTIAGKSFSVGSRVFQIYSVKSEVTDPAHVKKFINNVVVTKYGNKFSQKVLSDNFKNVSKRILKDRSWGDLRESLFNIYVNDEVTGKHYRICLDTAEVQKFLKEWAAGKKTIWVDGMSMDLERPLTIRIFNIAAEYRSKDKGDVKDVLRKWVAIARKKWSLMDYGHFGKDVTSEWKIPDYGSEHEAPAAEAITKFDWAIIHQTIAQHSKPRFKSGHFADAVESAFKELNDVVKREYIKLGNEELDGVKLMRTAFSPTNPKIKLTENSTDNERNVQEGYMNLFAGAIIGIRNPKAHANVTIDELEAWEKIVLASHLMKVWDKRIKDV